MSYSIFFASSMSACTHTFLCVSVIFIQHYSIQIMTIFDLLFGFYVRNSFLFFIVAYWKAEWMFFLLLVRPSRVQFVPFIRVYFYCSHIIVSSPQSPAPRPPFTPIYSVCLFSSIEFFFMCCVHINSVKAIFDTCGNCCASSSCSRFKSSHEFLLSI